MANVYIDQKYADLVNELSTHRTSFSGKTKTIFGTNMHLMVLAAMIGYQVAEEAEIDPVSTKGNEVSDRTFKSWKMDGVAYLMALHKTQEGDVLREKNENEVWKIFETYANRGFEEMNKWFTLEGVSDPEHVETILNKMKEFALINVRDKSLGPNIDEIEF